jgi:predicted metal-dependent hydrolase
MVPLKSNSGSYSLNYGNLVIKFYLLYGDRKSLGITVQPDKIVYVRAPYGKSIEDVYKRVRKHAAWIIKKLNYFEQFQPLQPPRQYVSGETHLYLGRQYRLKVLKDNNESVKLIGRFIIVRTKHKDNRRKTEIMLGSWYDLHAHSIIQGRMAKLLNTVTARGISEPTIKYKKMIRRWGSCNKNNLITLNTELVKAPLYSIDYVIMHELCHLKHKNHGPAFFRLLSSMMPDWEKRKERLQRIGI